MNEIVSKRKIVSRSSFIFTSLAYLTITRTSVPKRINFENLNKTKTIKLDLDTIFLFETISFIPLMN